MPKVSNKDIYAQDPSLDMEDYLLGTNYNSTNKKTQTYSLSSIFSLFYNFLGYNAFLFTTDTDTYPIASPGCFFAFDEDNEITSNFQQARKLTFSSNDTYNFNVTEYLQMLVDSDKFLFKLINLEDKNNFIFLKPRDFTLSNTLTSFDVNIEIQYGLSNGNFVNYKKYLLLLEFDANTFDPADYDLTDFTNTSVDPFVTEQDLTDIQIALDEINSTLNPDRIISLGTETIDVNEYTYEGYVWQLGGVQVNNVGNPSVIVIPSATVGFKRKDISVFTPAGTIERVAGTETDGEVVTSPDVPEGTLYYKSYDIDGDTIGVDPEPSPITGTQFKQKNESQKFTQVLGGTNAFIDLQTFGQQHYVVIGPVTSIVGFSKSFFTGTTRDEAPYDGKDFFLENKTDHNVTLKNAFSPVDIPFNLGADLIVPTNGIVWLKYNPATDKMDLFFKSWTDLSTKADLVGGKVPASQLPSSVFNIIEGYFNGTNFYTDALFTNLITPESGKIYINIAVTPATQYRWSGSAYVQIGGADTQVYKTINTNITLDNTYHNAVIWVTATCNITIPSGLRSDFNCTFRTLTGAIATFLTSGTTINAESDGDVQDAKTMSFLAQYTTNNYIISGGGLS